MRAAALPSGDLVIERARLSGKGSRGALEAGLGFVCAGDIAGADETLLIPRLCADAPLSARRTPGYFGHRLTEQLRALRDCATVDPRGPVPGAVALRFTSKARYAAWLLALWLEPRASRPGTDARLLPDAAEVRAWLLREVLSDGRVLVATAARLREQRLLAVFVGRLGPPELERAARSLEQAYSVPPTNEAPAAPAPTTLSAPRRGVRVAEPAQAPRKTVGAQNRTAMFVSEAWTGLAADEPRAKALERPRARLLLSLTVLAQRPNLGRQLAPALLDRARSAPAASGPPRAPLSERVAEQRRPRSLRQDQVGARQKALRQAPMRPSHVATAQPRHGLAVPPLVDATGSWTEQAVSEPGARQPHLPASSPARAMEASSRKFETAFGGVFFLVNALQALELYPDFTRPAEKGLGPSPFWLLDRLALWLLREAYRRDPLHRWLASVGEPGDLPRTWEADLRWLAGLPPGVHGLRRSRTRTILWDVRGFALVDAPASPPRACRNWLRHYRSSGLLQPRLPPLPSRRLPRDPGQRWIACLGEFLCWRLALAGEGIGSASLRLPARVAWDEERVTIGFDLATLPIELRLAGLDRDPGWLPAEGRSLSFRFD